MSSITNNELNVLISTLKEQARKNNSPLWSLVAQELESSARQRREVNISRINRYANENETIIVPGKVLGAGTLTKKLTIAAHTFSAGAREQVHNLKGTCITIQELLTKNPKGTNVKVIG